jgi:DNA-binding transcriptional regulator YiaG
MHINYFIAHRPVDSYDRVVRHLSRCRQAGQDGRRFNGSCETDESDEVALQKLACLLLSLCAEARAAKAVKAVKCSEQRAGYLLCRRVATWCPDHLPSPISLRMCAARVSGFTQRMSALAVTLKAEISRLARKEVRSTNTALSKAVTAHRTQIASLKRRMHEIEAGLRRAVRQSEAAPPVPTTDANGEKLRFRASGFAAHRKRLGLSAAAAGAFFAVGAQTIYNWEGGTGRPRKAVLPAIAAFRRLGKRASQ